MIIGWFSLRKISANTSSKLYHYKGLEQLDLISERVQASSKRSKEQKGISVKLTIGYH